MLGLRACGMVETQGYSEIPLRELFERVMTTGEQIKRERQAFFDRLYGPLIRSFIREQEEKQEQRPGEQVQEGRAQEYEVR